MKEYRYLLAMCYLAILTFAGCQGSGLDSPEQAAVRQISQASMDGSVVDTTTIEALQTMEFEGDMYVLMTYDRMWNIRDETCLVMYETHQEFFEGWEAGSGGGICTVGAENVNPLGLSGGVTFSQDDKEPDISYVLGRVNDPAIVKVSVTWEDGQMQEAAVVNGSFLVIRTGEAQMKFAVGLNAANEAIYTVKR